MTAELERLAGGGPDGAQEVAANGLVEVAAEFEGPGGAALAWERVRPVLETVAAPRRPWPATDEWRALLPRWFVDECSDDVTIVNCVLDKWSLRAWVYWFQPDQRRWTFWSRAVTDEGRVLRVAVEPTGQGSVLLGSLEWLLKSAGGTLLRTA